MCVCVFVVVFFFFFCFFFFVFFEEKKKKKKHFSKYINIKIEMNLCSGKTAKLKDLFPIESDYGLNAQLY